MKDVRMYIDCAMGAAGDMLGAALLELMPDREAAVAALNDIGVPGIKYEAYDDEKKGARGTHMRVTYNGEEEVTEDVHGAETHAHEGPGNCEHTYEHVHEHVHNTLNDITRIVYLLSLPEAVKEDVIGVYEIIAEAESIAHDAPVSEVHFHEVGSMDAVADAAAVCYLMNEIGPAAVAVSDIHVGTGFVKCAHGVLPVPAPATANILAGLPTYSSDIEGELCTPTGAALLKYFGTEFGVKQEDMGSDDGVIRVGRGTGRKDFERPNCVTVYLTEKDL